MASWARGLSMEPPPQADAILRLLCRLRGSASWAEGTGDSAEAPPGLGFSLFQKASGLLDGVQTRQVDGKRDKGKAPRKEGALPAAVLPTSLLRTWEHCSGHTERKRLFTHSPGPEMGRVQRVSPQLCDLGQPLPVTGAHLLP